MRVRAVDAVHLLVLPSDHDHAVARAQPRQQVVFELGAGLADLLELEHAHEVLERSALVDVREPGVDVGHAQVLPRVVGGVADRGHESLLLAGEHGRFRRIVGFHPVRPHLSQRIEFVAHVSLPIDARSSRKLTRARFSRDRTVPTGTPSARAISS